MQDTIFEKIDLRFSNSHFSYSNVYITDEHQKISSKEDNASFSFVKRKC